MSLNANKTQDITFGNSRDIKSLENFGEIFIKINLDFLILLLINIVTAK